jgi:hypothetical protein
VLDPEVLDDLGGLSGRPRNSGDEE